ncbi:LOW QUALITY PROTEIN: hypothetical protein ACHAW6_000194 [Cyclotella cf. meneghiniana]
MATAPQSRFLNTFLSRSGTCKRGHALNDTRASFSCATHMPCNAARAVKRRLTLLPLTNGNRQYSEIANFSRTRMSISAVRSNTVLLCSERTHVWDRRAPNDSFAASAASMSNLELTLNKP